MNTRIKLGELLKSSGFIDEYQLQSALSYQRNWGGRLGTCLVKLKYIDEEEILTFLGKQFGLERVDLYREDITTEVLRLLPEAKARQYQVIPVKMGERQGVPCLYYATFDPGNISVADDLRFIVGGNVQGMVASEEAIKAAIEVYYESVREEDSAPAKSDTEVRRKEASAKAKTVKAPTVKAPPTATRPGPKEAAAGKARPQTLEEKYQLLLKVLAKKGVLSEREYNNLK